MPTVWDPYNPSYQIRLFASWRRGLNQPFGF